MIDRGQGECGRGKAGIGRKAAFGRLRARCTCTAARARCRHNGASTHPEDHVGLLDILGLLL